ncbi:hypothetical protein [Streptomyces umbrinus]|uniref:hypothetical protein n=1 Tax=Streptomyces umbrinus TaxID=67370 RepID=UPI001671BE6F|nr:hypothetical protein [Streptomyces umbrinus]
MGEMREQARDYLEGERRDVARYNVDGIIRDAWINGNGSEETWKAAVEKNRYPFLVGDRVRVVVEIDGFQEHLYGILHSFRTASNGIYRRRILNPHSAYVELVDGPSGALRPLSEITPELDDFEITTEHSEVHRDGPRHNYGIFHCVSGIHAGYPPPAHALVTHKRSGIKRRFCNDCNDADQRARLGHEMWRDRQLSRDTILSLTEHPEVITASVGDDEADKIRAWADVVPYLVPEKAAELYTEWKESQSATVAA